MYICSKYAWIHVWVNGLLVGWTHQTKYVNTQCLLTSKTTLPQPKQPFHYTARSARAHTHTYLVALPARHAAAYIRDVCMSRPSHAKFKLTHDQPMKSHIPMQDLNAHVRARSHTHTHPHNPHTRGGVGFLLGWAAWHWRWYMYM